MNKVTDIRDWMAQHNYMDAYKRENHMVVPYADPETSERYLPDPDEQYEIEREEIDEARKAHVESLNEALRDIARLEDMLKPQAG